MNIPSYDVSYPPGIIVEGDSGMNFETKNDENHEKPD